MKNYKNILLLLIGILLGIVSNRYRSYLIDAQFIRQHFHFRKVVADKEKIINSEEVMVFLAIGQSNAGSFGDGTYVPRNEVYDYYRGNLYNAKEPLLGGDGGGSSPWTRLADLVIDNGLYKKVIIVPCAIGGTSIQCWSEGDCRIKLEKTLEHLEKDNIQLTHVFWLQGETDNVDNTSSIQYKSSLKEIIELIREKQGKAIFYTSITSYFPFGNDKPFGIDSNITNAQWDVIKEVNDVKPGPNSDSLNLAIYRHDAIHFTEKGLDRLAYEWFKKIK